MKQRIAFEWLSVLLSCCVFPLLVVAPVPTIPGANPVEEKIVHLIRSQCPADVVDGLGWHSDDTALADLRMHRYRHLAVFVCGYGGLYAEALSGGLRAIYADNMLNTEHDLASTAGFIFWIRACLTLMVGALAIFGLPCQTFCWLAMGHTKRSTCFPLGNENRSDVKEANLLVIRVLVLVKLLVLREVYYLLENPLGSMLWAQVAWKRSRSSLKIRKHKPKRQLCWLGAYGCEISKPVIFDGICPGVNFIKRPRPKKFHCARQKQTLGWFSWLQKQADGTFKRRWMGKRALKQTGEYPLPLCKILVQICKWQRANTLLGKL